MKILLAGGGTGGPVAPLLAVAQKIKDSNPAAEFLFVGTKTGPERRMVEAAGFAFKSISAAKWRRYFSLRNVADIFVFAISFFQAKKLISEFKPDLVFSVGGFVAVPIVFAASRRKIRIVIHQQDAQPGLANRMCRPYADVTTCAFEETAQKFQAGSAKPVIWVGNPVRKEFFSPETPYKESFGLHGELPVLLIFGGATGASRLNEVVLEAGHELVKSHQVVHITGAGKQSKTFSDSNYHQFEFLTKEMPTIMKMADIVVCRAGLSTIAELSALSKVAVVVPIPDSHQEGNAAILKQRAAAVVLDRQEFTAENLARVITSLKFNVARQELLAKNMGALMPKDSTDRLATIIVNSINAK